MTESIKVMNGIKVSQSQRLVEGRIFENLSSEHRFEISMTKGVKLSKY